jgi:hypothetical protein
MLKNKLDVDHRIFHYQQKNILNWEISYHDRQLEILSVHQQDLLKRKFDLQKKTISILPKALDNVAANIPANQKKINLLKMKIIATNQL